MKYRRRLVYYLIRIFRLHDSPKAVAGGLAWGTFVHFFPTFGGGALFAVSLAGLFRTNLAAATVAWAITLPLFPVFFYINFLVGNWLLDIDAPDIICLVNNIVYFKLSEVFLLGRAFLLGSLVNALVSLGIIWWSGSYLLKRFRKETLQFIRHLKIKKYKR